MPSSLYFCGIESWWRLLSYSKALDAHTSHHMETVMISVGNSFGILKWMNVSGDHVCDHCAVKRNQVLICPFLDS